MSTIIALIMLPINIAIAIIMTPFMVIHLIFAANKAVKEDYPTIAELSAKAFEDVENDDNLDAFGTPYLSASDFAGRPTHKIEGYPVHKAEYDQYHDSTNPEQRKSIVEDLAFGARIIAEFRAGKKDDFIPF